MQQFPGGNVIPRALSRLRRSAPLWETGGEGERLLREELEPLRADGYEMVHDRLLDPDGRVVLDTILVGPGGVFVFDAKHWWGKVYVEHNRLVQEKRHRRDRTEEITKLLEATKRVGQVASSYVHPYLVLTGEAQMPGSPFVGKVRIREVSGTAAMVRSQIQTVPPHDVRRIAAAVDAAFPPRRGRGEDASEAAAAAVLPTRPRPADPGSGGMVAPSLLSHLRGGSSTSSSEPRASGFAGIFSSRTEAAPHNSDQSTASSNRSQSSGQQGDAHATHPGRWSRRRRHERPATPGTWAESERRSLWRRLATVPVVLALLGALGVLVLVAGGAAVVEKLVPCSAVDEGSVEQLTGRDLDGRRRWRGGCIFDDSSGEQAVLVLTGSAAERRAPGTSGMTVSRKENCGVLVIAPSGAALRGYPENAKRRSTAAAACVRPSAGDRTGRRAERTAIRIVAAVRREAAQA